MKKLSVISLLLMSSIMCLGGCNKSSGESGGGGSGGGGGGGQPADGKVQVDFYIDFNQWNAKETYYSVRVANGSKLTAPATPTKAPMPEFPVFLGWSKKEVIDNKEDLWDFSTDVVETTTQTFNLFGIWVVEGEQNK